MRGSIKGLAVLAGLFGAFGVGLAAAGAHMSDNPTVTTAASFFLFHAGALVGLCAVAEQTHGRGVILAAGTIALGTILFSGELTLHAFTGVTALTKVAPIGGTLMIVGWLIAAVTLPLALGRDNRR